MDAARDRIDAVYASERLKLTLEGILLVGYRPGQQARHGASRRRTPAIAR
jgi:hypothetical protein